MSVQEKLSQEAWARVEALLREVRDLGDAEHEQGALPFRLPPLEELKKQADACDAAEVEEHVQQALADLSNDHQEDKAVRDEARALLKDLENQPAEPWLRVARSPSRTAASHGETWTWDHSAGTDQFRISAVEQEHGAVVWTVRVISEGEIREGSKLRISPLPDKELEQDPIGGHWVAQFVVGAQERASLPKKLAIEVIAPE